MFQRLTLSARVFLASGLSALVVLTLLTALVAAGLEREVSVWERERLAGFAHHAAQMAEDAPPGMVEATVAEVARGLAPFGVSLGLSHQAPEAGGELIVVPLSSGSKFIVASSADRPAAGLQRRLLRGWILLIAGVLFTLLVAVRLSIHWGFVRPLRQLERQLRRMSKGGWGDDRAVAAGPELGRLSESIGAMGASVETNMRQWLAAERMASAERARVVIGRQTLELRRRLNLHASQLLAAKGLCAEERRSLRRFLDVLGELGGVLRGPGVSMESEGDALRRLELEPSVAGAGKQKEEQEGD